MVKVTFYGRMIGSTQVGSLDPSEIGYGIVTDKDNNIIVVGKSVVTLMVTRTLAVVILFCLNIIH